MTEDIMKEDDKIALIYRGVQAGMENTYDEYDICIKTALVYHYQDIPTLVFEFKDHDYQGETVGLMKGTYKRIDDSNDYRSRIQWYFYQFGWGSCSGCDMLQGDGPIETIKHLKNDIVPIPLDTITVTQYITNELQNNYHKYLVQQLLDKWTEYIREHKFDDNGDWIRK